MNQRIEKIKKYNLTYTSYWLNLLKRLEPESKRYINLLKDIDETLEIYQKKQYSLTKLAINYPDELPVSREVSAIKELIDKNQVIIICGETGSGKTTQLPKILLDMGYGNTGIIGHTQPRRIAAKSLASRINQELGFATNTENSVVGYKMRFHDRTNQLTAIKLMTDGILLQEIQHDKLLLQYSALIIDEVHERSLNIDFILGYLHELVKKRPDLKIIITSATLENDKLTKFFANAAILNVSGKTYPVDIVYQPFTDDEDELTLNQAIYQAIESALAVEAGNGLVFLPGEREIKHCMTYLRKTSLKNYEILPLYAKQNNEEQAQIFADNGRIKIILATNIAETSLTIPGIKFVIDSGLARVKRYNIRNRVEQLQIENISQASSKQRAGRAGRVSHGLCVRLFSELEFNQRRPYTEPELLRSNLANVILRLLSLNIGDPATFSFLDMPEHKAFNDGFRNLYQIGAIDETNRITNIGRKLANIPIDISLARVLLAAGDKFACLREALIVVSFLAIQDPRETPIEHQQIVRERHAIWADKKSEFLQIINLWKWYHNELTHKKSNKKLLEICHKQFLSLVRMREWHELHRQLKETMLELGLRENSLDASYENLHRAILSGFPVNIGQKDIVDNYYLSTNSRKFYLHPSLQITPAKWVVAVNLVETSKLYARHCAEIEPEWLNGIANHLYRYNYSDEHWDKKRGEVLALKTSLLYGLAISQQKVSFASINPELSRELMIREGIVPNNMGQSYEFVAHNGNVVCAIEKLEDKLRMSLVIMDDELYDYYDERIAKDVIDRVTFNSFLATNPRILHIDQKEFIARITKSSEHQELFPDYLENNGRKIRLQYIFDHESNEDGVVALIDLATLSVVNEDKFTWLVPGMIRDKIAYLIKTLPKTIRLQFNPQQDSISEFLAYANPEAGLIQQFVNFAKEYKKIDLDYASLLETKFATQYCCHFRVLEAKKIIASGDDLASIKIELASKLNKIVVKHTSEQQINNLTTFIPQMSKLLEPQSISTGSSNLSGFNSLIVEKNKSITFGVVLDSQKAKQSTKRGLIELIKLQLKEQQKYLASKKIANFPAISFALIDAYSRDDLIVEIADYILNQAVLLALGESILVDAGEFEKVVTASRANVSNILQEFSDVINRTANLYRDIKLKIDGHVLEENILIQLDDLIYEKFLQYTKWQNLRNFPRYLQAILLRIDKYSKSPQKDSSCEEEVNLLYDKWYNYVDDLESKNKTIYSELYDFRYKLEELRISLFAQELKTLYPVSVKRLSTELEELYLKNLQKV